MSSTRISKPVLMMDVKVCKDKNISRWVDQENLGIESKTVHKLKKVIDRGKRSKAMSEVKPVENINQNLQSFPGIRPVQRKSFFHVKCETMHMRTRILLN